MTFLAIASTLLTIGFTSSMLVAGLGILADLILTKYAKDEGTKAFLSRAGDILRNILDWTMTLLYFAFILTALGLFLILVPYLWSLA